MSSSNVASGWRNAVGTSPMTPSSWPRARSAPSISTTARVPVREVDRATGCADVHLHRANRGHAVLRLDDERLEPAGERLEVALGPGRERPVEVHRQGDRVLLGPCRPSVAAVRRLAEAAGDAGVERRNEAGEPAGVGAQAAGAQQSGDVAVGIAGDDRRRFGACALGDEQLGVRPGPRIAEVGSSAAAPDSIVSRGSGAPGGGDRDAGTVLDDDEGEPRPQLARAVRPPTA